MQHIQRTLIAGLLTLIVTFGATALVPAVAFADASTDAARQAACEGSGGTWSGGKCTTAGPSLDAIIANVVNIISILVGIAAVIMIMVGGFKYITSGGDTGNVNSAKQTILYAIIGLVIVAFAQFIVQFVIKTSSETPAPKPKAKAALSHTVEA
jgi:uncharacterized membrane protein YuzA (DUF378 family)